MNGTQDDAGVYTCVGERAMDRTYVSSWVHLAQPMTPVMLFLPCNDLSPSTAPAGGSPAQPHQVNKYTVNIIIFTLRLDERTEKDSAGFMDSKKKQMSGFLTKLE